MKRFVAAAALTAAVVLALAATASADVQRYQTGTLTITLPAYGYVHDYAITVCGTEFTGTGGIESLGLKETITGTLEGTTLRFRADYLTYNPGYYFQHDTYPFTFAAHVSEYRNHGEFVSRATDKQAAAQSPVGMPCG